MIIDEDPNRSATINSLTYRADLNSDNSDILVTTGLHSGVEKLGRRIVNHLAEHPIKRVRTLETYPEIEDLGVRYLGNRELGAHFDLDVFRGKTLGDLDPDQQAAWRFICSTHEEEDTKYWLGIDPHTDPTPNADCLFADINVLPYVIGVAGVLGLERVIVTQD